MIYVNNCAFGGRLGKDAEIKKFGENEVASFSLAVNYSQKDGTGYKDVTFWLGCQLWRPTDYQKKSLVKGAGVYVEGQLEPVEKDGKTYLNFRCTTVKIDAGKEASTLQPQKMDMPAPSNERPLPPIPDEDEMPF